MGLLCFIRQVAYHALYSVFGVFSLLNKSGEEFVLLQDVCVTLACLFKMYPFLITIRIAIFLPWVIVHFAYHWQFYCALINSDYVPWSYLASFGIGFN